MPVPGKKKRTTTHASDSSPVQSATPLPDQQEFHASLQEHLGQLTQTQLVPQPPEDDNISHVFPFVGVLTKDTDW